MKFKMAALFYQPRKMNVIQDGGFILPNKKDEWNSKWRLYITVPLKKMNEIQDGGFIIPLKKDE